MCASVRRCLIFEKGVIVGALERTIVRHIPDLRRYARVLLRDLSEAEELVQESLVRALARRHHWRRIRDPRAYLFSVMHNAYVDRLARQKRMGLPIELDRVAWRLARPAPQPASLELRDLARAVAALSDEQRQVLLLVGLEGLSYQQVSEALNVPLGTVMSRLSRARDAVRQMMDGDGTTVVRRAYRGYADQDHHLSSGALGHG